MMPLVQTRVPVFLMVFGKAKAGAYKSATVRMINAALNTKSAQEDILKAVGTSVNTSVLINDLHSSGSDVEPHYTVDLYNQFEPVGCAHIYSTGKYKIFVARKKARKVLCNSVVLNGWGSDLYPTIFHDDILTIVWWATVLSSGQIQSLDRFFITNGVHHIQALTTGPS